MTLFLSNKLHCKILLNVDLEARIAGQDKFTQTSLVPQKYSRNNSKTIRFILFVRKDDDGAFNECINQVNCLLCITLAQIPVNYDLPFPLTEDCKFCYRFAAIARRKVD